MRHRLKVRQITARLTTGPSPFEGQTITSSIYFRQSEIVRCECIIYYHTTFRLQTSVPVHLEI
jgi:hypothetical protein